MLSFNDPLDSFDPEDKRGALDNSNFPKETYWALAFLYSPLQVIKKGEDFYLRNHSTETFEDFLVSPRSEPIKQFGPNQILKITSIINSTSTENRFALHRLKNGKSQRILYFHPQGRLSGCIFNIGEQQISSENIYIAKYKNSLNLKATDAEIHFSGESDFIEIHPKSAVWKVSGIKDGSLRVLSKCRKPFYRVEL